jgi:hypothetical protein
MSERASSAKGPSTLPDYEELTSTQQLLLEVLAARYRLGEQCWTFTKKNRPTLASLCYDGYLAFKSGIVQNTYLAWLTDAGREAMLDADYSPPAANARLTEQVPE